MCIWPRCKGRGKPAPMPLTGQIVSLCDRHRGPRFLAHMRGLVAH